MGTAAVTEGLVALVDFWGAQPSLKHYFLTHMHAGEWRCRLYAKKHTVKVRGSDHHEGLHAAWRAGRIYCTDVTRRLLVHRLDVDASLIVSAILFLARLAQRSFDANGAAQTVLEIGRTTRIFLDDQEVGRRRRTPLSSQLAIVKLFYD